MIKKDDLLIVKSIDRLGRNYQMILEEWFRITKTIGADIKVLGMPLLDTRIEGIKLANEKGVKFGKLKVITSVNTKYLKNKPF